VKHGLSTAAAVAVLLAAAAAPAQPQPSAGFGGVSCSQYLRAGRMSDILYHQSSAWLLGYFSGVSAGMRVAPGSSPLAGLTNDQVLKSVGDYCERNPASTLAQAAAEWAPPPAPPPPQQAESKPAPSSGSWIINLDRGSDRKPLLERR
jgi:hypothetical protein